MRGMLLAHPHKMDREDSHVECRLMTCKTQAAPKVKITIPRMVLWQLAAVAACNLDKLTQKVRESLRIPIKVLHRFVVCTGHTAVE
jgi:hypothetical protein